MVSQCCLCSHQLDRPLDVPGALQESDITQSLVRNTQRSKAAFLPRCWLAAMSYWAFSAGAWGSFQVERFQGCKCCLFLPVAVDKCTMHGTTFHLIKWYFEELLFWFKVSQMETQNCILIQSITYRNIAKYKVKHLRHQIEWYGNYF